MKIMNVMAEIIMNKEVSDAVRLAEYKEYSNAMRLSEFMFFHIPLDRHESGDYCYYNDGYICGLCGEVIDTDGGRGGAKRHIFLNHDEWTGVFIILSGFSHLMLSKSKEFALNLLSNENVTKDNKYYCLLCGMPLYEESRMTHIECNHPEWINVLWCKEKRKYDGPRKLTHPLKPWRDPESLFCSPNLKYIIDKEPLQGKECREKRMPSKRNV
jgi:hypothetical protein